MADDTFEWDDRKAADNYAKHGIGFEFSKQVFSDPFAIERLDDREDYGEDRFILIGSVEQLVLCVTYAERRGRIRLISARRATKREQNEYFTQDD
jgi:uncharacterized DUF497 family protein